MRSSNYFSISINNINNGEIIPLAIAQAKIRLDFPELDLDLERCQKLLAQAQQITIVYDSPTRQLVIMRSQRQHFGVDSLA